MTKEKFLSFTLIGFLILLFNFNSCKKDEPLNLVIKLRWSKAYPNEHWSNVQTGLKWALSYLGAELKYGSFNNSVKMQADSCHFTLNLSTIGFSKSAILALREICDNLQQSEEYTKMDGVDLGRFIMLTLGKSENYYRITGMPSTFAGFKALHTQTALASYGNTVSTISKNHRLIYFHLDTRYNHTYFICEEGTGSLIDKTFKTEGYEVIDIMPNSQPRFGVYDKNGNLMNAADTLLSIAGKPIKCMWCHESNLLPLYTIPVDVSGYITSKQFVAYVDSANKLLGDYRSSIKSDIEFNNKDDHTQAELLYISFMEPSKERLSVEWNSSLSSIKSLLSSKQTHVYFEFPFLGDLHHRREVDYLSPYKSVEVPKFAREE